MQEISVLDLQNLRHLIGGYETTHCKMENYAQEATDPQIKQFFAESSSVCRSEQTAASSVFIKKGDQHGRKNNGFRRPHRH